MLRRFLETVTTHAMQNGTTVTPRGSQSTGAGSPGVPHSAHGGEGAGCSVVDERQRTVRGHGENHPRNPGHAAQGATLGDAMAVSGSGGGFRAGRSEMLIPADDEDKVGMKEQSSWQ